MFVCLDVVMPVLFEERRNDERSDPREGMDIHLHFVLFSCLLREKFLDGKRVCEVPFAEHSDRKQYTPVLRVAFPVPDTMCTFRICENCEDPCFNQILGFFRAQGRHAPNSMLQSRCVETLHVPNSLPRPRMLAPGVQRVRGVIGLVADIFSASDSFPTSASYSCA